MRREGAFSWLGVLSPAFGAGGGEAEEVEHAVHAEIDDIHNGLGLMIEAGDGRGDDGSHFGELGHGAEVAEVEGGFADEEDELAAFFQGDVGGADEEIGADAMGDGGHGMDGAGSDDHGFGEEGTAGEAAADILDGVVTVGQSADFGAFFTGFEPGGAFAGAGEDEVGANSAAGAEAFEEAEAVDGAACTGDSNN